MFMLCTGGLLHATIHWACAFQPKAANQTKRLRLAICGGDAMGGRSGSTCAAIYCCMSRKHRRHWRGDVGKRRRPQRDVRRIADTGRNLRLPGSWGERHRACRNRGVSCGGDSSERGRPIECGRWRRDIDLGIQVDTVTAVAACAQRGGRTSAAEGLMPPAHLAHAGGAAAPLASALRSSPAVTSVTWSATGCSNSELPLTGNLPKLLAGVRICAILGGALAVLKKLSAQLCALQVWQGLQLRRPMSKLALRAFGTHA
mmetsp:Transcript_68129/g.197472  ORF Transcript_68129/g.197472 Transcript_68129/m.197472 type:complete len:258 (+) Transcript_68129:563-1336(+)